MLCVHLYYTQCKYNLHIVYTEGTWHMGGKDNAHYFGNPCVAKVMKAGASFKKKAVDMYLTRTDTENEIIDDIVPTTRMVRFVIHAM